MNHAIRNRFIHLRNSLTEIADELQMFEWREDEDKRSLLLFLIRVESYIVTLPEEVIDQDLLQLVRSMILERKRTGSLQ